MTSKTQPGTKTRRSNSSKSKLSTKPTSSTGSTRVSSQTLLKSNQSRVNTSSSRRSSILNRSLFKIMIKSYLYYNKRRINTLRKLKVCRLKMIRRLRDLRNNWPNKNLLKVYLRSFKIKTRLKRTRSKSSYSRTKTLIPRLKARTNKSMI